jgi:hypothetical protein
MADTSTKITVMINVSGRRALLGRFNDTPGTRRELNEACARLHWLSDRHTYFEIVDSQGAAMETMRDGMTKFMPVGGA